LTRIEVNVAQAEELPYKEGWPHKPVDKRGAFVYVSCLCTHGIALRGRASFEHDVRPLSRYWTHKWQYRSVVYRVPSKSVTGAQKYGY